MDSFRIYSRNDINTLFLLVSWIGYTSSSNQTTRPRNKIFYDVKFRCICVDLRRFIMRRNFKSTKSTSSKIFLLLYFAPIFQPFSHLLSTFRFLFLTWCICCSRLYLWPAPRTDSYFYRNDGRDIDLSRVCAPVWSFVSFSLQYVRRRRAARRTTQVDPVFQRCDGHHLRHGLLVV